MSSSYQAAGWVGFACFAAIGILGGIILRWNAKHQTTRLKLLLYLIVVSAAVVTYGFEALPGLGGNNVVAGLTVNWARYVLYAMQLSLFAAFASLCLDPNTGKAFVMFWLGLGASLPTVFACQSSNLGVWYFWIFSGISVVLFGIYVFWFLQVPDWALKNVSNGKAWFAKILLVLGYLVFVFVGYLIDTPWMDPTGSDLALLQWLNIGWGIIFFLGFGLFMVGWVDLYEGENLMGGISLGTGGLPFMMPVHTSPCASNMNGATTGYAPLPNAQSVGLAMPQ